MDWIADLVSVLDAVVVLEVEKDPDSVDETLDVLEFVIETVDVVVPVEVLV